MAHTSRTRSTASRVFVVLLVAAVVIGALVAVFLVVEAQRSIRAEAERVTAATATSFASSPLIIDGLRSSDQDAATQVLEPYSLAVITGAGLDFITVMTTDGTRLTHPDTDQIGGIYLGTIPASPQALTEEFTGTLGPSVRTIAPVTAPGGELIGWVAAGVTTESITDTLVRRLPLTLGITVGLVAIGAGGAVIARRVTRRIAGDLPPGQVRDAVSSYESIRTLGEALRAQTHEHGNRMHAAVALLELGRPDEAIEILTETSRQSQSLVDQVTARRHGDPAVGALLLGKASQAKERGIDWRVHIEPDTPRTPLSPVDAVSVLGNLVDNAMDAAVDSEDRWVQVSLRPNADAGIVLEVSDSGPGIPPDLRGRIFDQGFSTKPADAHGRGVGLALVRSVVTGAGGSVTVSGEPTTFRVVLPAAGTRRTQR
ncbi:MULTISPECIES: ATP-binding protein [unclassified Microbacterium]|uniref:sensor histidine kinase n=1 Tax=unclassified Microbacterium TaxID=2609290 RepID=UPI000CFB2174|nr:MULTISPECIES: ATP-binding protein [unclassified Microbacterium]PQZ61289.1 ATPase [Microbacterium sp. MYb43]PQZ82500.1 ATPase [Microbacterium sp. MYb40]PRB23799.1 ATPase [Microbacterium sp. MYb54]PRB29694.1 ATPase [Microbacterium sp. MYb50]PRB70947.1 ATPase [Microbacterium sp. MYb24]